MRFEEQCFLDCKRIAIHIKMADECVLDKQIDFLDVIQVEDGQAVRWSQDGVPQKQVLEVFVHLVFCERL